MSPITVALREDEDPLQIELLLAVTLIVGIDLTLIVMDELAESVQPTLLTVTKYVLVKVGLITGFWMVEVNPIGTDLQVYVYIEPPLGIAYNIVFIPGQTKVEFAVVVAVRFTILIATEDDAVSVQPPLVTTTV